MARVIRSVPAPGAPVTLTVDRLAVLAHRARAHGLDRASGSAAELPSLGLGIQDSPPGAARLGFSARLASADAAAGWDGDPDLTVAWSLRGAPHVHRSADLPALAAALWPHDDADASARLAWNAKRVAESGRSPVECLELTAAAVAEVASSSLSPGDVDGDVDGDADGDVDGDTDSSADRGVDGGFTKGLLSAEVTRLLPPELSRWCEPCGSTHVHEQLLRLAALPGGLVVTGSAPLTFAALPGWPGVPAGPAGTGQVARAYLHLYGPAVPADLATFLGCTPAVAKAVWPDDAVPVSVDGRRAWALPEDVDALAGPPTPPDVRLLPPNDAFLKAGDRAVLVPDRSEQKAIWKVLGSPGVLLVDAVPAGIWRPKATAKRLDLTVEPFVPLDGATRRAVAREHSRLATVRSLTPGTLTFPS
jgi:hypothetical protein